MQLENELLSGRVRDLGGELEKERKRPTVINSPTADAVEEASTTTNKRFPEKICRNFYNYVVFSLYYSVFSFTSCTVTYSSLASLVLRKKIFVPPFLFSCAHRHPVYSSISF